MSDESQKPELSVSVGQDPVSTKHAALPGQSGTSRFAYGVEANPTVESSTGLINKPEDRPTSGSTYGYGGPAGEDPRGPGAGPTGAPWTRTGEGVGSATGLGTGSANVAEGWDSATGEFVGRAK